MIEINHNPARSDLRWFGVIFACFFGLIGAVIGWRFDAWNVARVLWIVGGTVGALYYAVPAAQRWIFVGWLYVTFPLSWFMSHLLMAVTYYLVVTPTGLLLRLFGKDPMNRRLDRQATTYWIKHPPVPRTERYFKQY